MLFYQSLENYKSSSKPRQNMISALFSNRWFSLPNKSATIFPLEFSEEYDEYDSNQPIEIVVVKSDIRVTSPRNSRKVSTWNPSSKTCLYEAGEPMTMCLAKTIMNHRNMPRIFTEHSERLPERTRFDDARRTQYTPYCVDFEDDYTVYSSDEDQCESEYADVKMPPRATLYVEWCEEGTP